MDIQGNIFEECQRNMISLLAAVKKEMALVQSLLQAGVRGNDADDLLAWALQQSVRRVVVKRPPRASALGGNKPSHQLLSKAIRYDVYTLGSWD